MDAGAVHRLRRARSSGAPAGMMLTTLRTQAPTSSTSTGLGDDGHRRTFALEPELPSAAPIFPRWPVADARLRMPTGTRSRAGEETDGSDVRAAPNDLG